MSENDMIFQLAENTSKRVQVAKVGVFEHEIYGKFSITASDLKQMKSNFEANIRRQKIEGRPVLPFDYSHADAEKAAGWIVGLEIDDNKLFAEVEWTPKAAEKIRNKEFKFVSPSIRRNYKDAETGQKFNIILVGAALTNIPFLKDMEAVHLLSESRQAAFMSLKLSGDEPDFNFNLGENMPELIEKFKSMSPDEQSAFLAECGLERKPDEQNAFLAECGLERKDEKLSEKNQEIKNDLTKAQNDLELSEDENKRLKEKMSLSDDAADKLKLAQSEINDLKTNIASLIKQQAEDKQKSTFDLMLSEGQVCEAQRKAFMKGDIFEFIKNAQEVKLSESGNNSRGDEEDDIEQKVLKMADEKMKEDKDLAFSDAVSMVLSENPKYEQELGY